MAGQVRTKTLAELGLTAKAGRDARITGLTVDSRRVDKGGLFAAMPGTKVHGASFIEAALRAGAGAV
ncbi:MAG: Mur ligase domain-containing protein, partial [Paracoccaceae bacterium]